MYTNITLRTANLDAVLDFLNGQRVVAFVTPPQNDTLVVYDRASESQDDAILTARTAALSRQFDCPTLAVLNHDDDILAYWLYDKGMPLDHDNSAPGYFSGDDTPPAGGDAALLCRVFGVDPSQSAQIEAILRAPSMPDADISPTELLNAAMHDPAGLPDLLRQLGMDATRGQAGAEHNYLFAMERHEALVDALGLPDYAIGLGFNYVSRGELPPDLSANDLRRTGPTD